MLYIYVIFKSRSTRLPQDCSIRATVPRELFYIYILVFLFIGHQDLLDATPWMSTVYIYIICQLCLVLGDIGLCTFPAIFYLSGWEICNSVQDGASKRSVAMAADVFDTNLYAALRVKSQYLFAAFDTRSFWQLFALGVHIYSYLIDLKHPFLTCPIAAQFACNRDCFVFSLYLSIGERNVMLPQSKTPVPLLVLCNHIHYLNVSFFCVMAATLALKLRTVFLICRWRSVCPGQ